MKLKVDFSALHRVVQQMGADSLVPDFTLNRRAEALTPIEIKLGEGVEITLEDVTFVSAGLASYHGYQVLLYIQDHGSKIESVLSGKNKGNKYHVAYCRTLQDMKKKGRYERYVATNDTSGHFLISGTSAITKKYIKKKANLLICRNCLDELRYQGYKKHNNSQSNAIFKRFTLKEFFSTYSSFFPNTPKRRAGEYDGYTDDWTKISQRYRASQRYCCEHCHVCFTDDRYLLHTHHRNGVKSDNRETNLQALCLDCHRKQPFHEKMTVTHKEMQIINTLRRDQSIINSNITWDKVFDFADSGVHGVLHELREQKFSCPEVHYPIKNSLGQIVVFLELAWPKKRKGIGIADASIRTAQELGWTVETVTETLKNFMS